MEEALGMLKILLEIAERIDYSKLLPVGRDVCWGPKLVLSMSVLEPKLYKELEETNQ